MTPPRHNRPFRHLRKWVKTTAFQSSLLFALVFSIVVVFAMLLVFRCAKVEIAALVDSRLRQQGRQLARELTEEMRFGPLLLDQMQPLPGEEQMSYCVVRRDQSASLYELLERQSEWLLNSQSGNLCQVRSNSTAPGLFRLLLRPLDNRYLLVLGHNTEKELAILTRMRQTITNAVVALLLMAFFGAFWVSRNILSIIANIRRTAQKIIHGDFSRRIPLPANTSDEITLLTEDLNLMLAKIETLLNTQRQVTSNIAHDLRSPLNRLRNRLEVALIDRKNSEGDLRAAIEASITDTENLLRTFNALLNIAQVESRAKDDFVRTDLSQIGRDLAELYEVLSEEGSHHFRAEVADGLWVLGNRHLLAQAITNLLDNAVKYTPEGGQIQLSASLHGGKVVVAVADNGKGIPQDQVKEVVKRFVRLDSARSTGGNGLGLALVNAVVELHGGTLAMYDNRPGLRVEISFSALAPERPPPPTGFI